MTRPNRDDVTQRRRAARRLAEARRLQLQHALRGDHKASARYARLADALRKNLVGLGRSLAARGMIPVG